jgi:hypothetical protein
MRPLTALVVASFLLAPAVSVAASDPIVVGGVTAEGFVTSTTAARFNRGIQVVNTDQKDVARTVDLADFIAPDSRSIATTWWLNDEKRNVYTVTVPGAGKTVLHVQALLPEPGLYQAMLTLIYGGKRYLPMAVKIARSSGQLPLKIVGLDPAILDQSPRFSLTERVFRDVRQLCSLGG